MNEFMDLEQYHALLEFQPNRSKYGNKRVKADGYTFDSQAEYQRYCELKTLQRTGEISLLRVHPRFVIMEAYTIYTTGERIKARHYEADFEYYDVESMRRVVEDVKGKRTDVFNLKWDLVRKAYQDEPIDWVLVNV